MTDITFVRTRQEPVYIYGLFDPRNLELRYIGKTHNLGNRIRDHVYRAKTFRGDNPHKDNWIRQLLSENLEPAIEILEECTEENWEEIERAWIKEASEKGLKLVNIRKGGEGVGSGEEAPWFGIKGNGHPTFGIRRFGDKNGMWGKEQSEHTRKLISKTNKEKYSDPTKTPWYNKKLSEEHKQKISKSKIGYKHSVEFIDNLKLKLSGSLNPMYGKKHKQDARDKMRVSYALYMANKKNNLCLILELQEEYLRLYGSYHDKYPHR